ncbi:MAG TPA: N-acetylmuramoyl-L-alanine amidase [Mycobacterium sp.]|nr:N-acetylmuramoyl-L-alanine amidase [Mycobacterium sp.]
MSNTDDYGLAVIAEGQTARTSGADYVQHPVITPRGIQIALATVYVESDFTMYANASDPDSLDYPHDAVGSDHLSDGLFQQQPPWWGTVAERMDPALSAAMFYHALSGLDYNDPNTSPGTFAQDVQGSEFPGRYDQRFADAVALYNQLAGSAPAPTVAAPNFNEVNQIGQCQNFADRGGANVDMWIIHTEEGASATAFDLATFLNSTTGTANPVSYHYAIDNNVNVVDVVDTDYASWSVLSANNRSINLCFAGSTVNWTRDEWLQNMGNAIDVAAYLAVQDCRKYGINVGVLSPPYNSDPPGITDHKYVTDWLGDGTHTDVGPNFPWDTFTAAINKYAGKDNFLMSLSDQDQKTLLAAANKILAAQVSRSIYRASNDPVDDTVGMLLNIDATTFDILTEHQALLGDPVAYGRVKALANGQGPAAVDPNAVAHAKFILSKCPTPINGVAVVGGQPVAQPAN